MGGESIKMAKYLLLLARMHESSLPICNGSLDGPKMFSIFTTIVTIELQTCFEIWLQIVV